MPDLHELLDGSVGTPPPFDLGALARRRRRHRQRQIGALAGVVVVLASISGAFALGRATSDHPVAIRTHGEPTTTAVTSTTIAPSTTTGVHRTVPTAPPVGSTTSTPTQPTSAAGGSPNPGPDDFDGLVVPAATSVTAGQPVRIAWAIRNRTDHEIFPDYNASFAPEQNPQPPTPNDVALVCLGSNPGARLVLGAHNVFVPNWVSLASGAGVGESDTYVPTTDDVGTVTCEVVILDLSNGFSDMRIADRVHAIAPVTITVTAPVTTTSAPSNTTTVPAT